MVAGCQTPVSSKGVAFCEQFVTCATGICDTVVPSFFPEMEATGKHSLTLFVPFLSLPLSLSLLCAGKHSYRCSIHFSSRRLLPCSMILLSQYYTLTSSACAAVVVDFQFAGEPLEMSISMIMQCWVNSCNIKLGGTKKEVTTTMWSQAWQT